MKLYPTTIVGGAIAIYENVWDELDNDMLLINSISSDETSKVYFSKAQIKDETKNSFGLTKIRTNDTLDLNKHSEINNNIKHINNKFNKILNDYLISYGKTFNINEKFFYTENNYLLKYTESQYYKEHYDGHTLSKRFVSPILYLNDNYEGGEIEFINFGIKLKPKAGSLIVFPSNYAYRHIAHPVISGAKYAIVTWIHDC